MCRDNSWYGCGASILSCDPVLIITAAHCVYNRFADENNINGEIKVKKTIIGASRLFMNLVNEKLLCAALYKPLIFQT